MRSKKIFLVLLSLGILMLWPGAARAVMPAYMYVVGETQGNIDGSVTQQGREDSILVEAFGHSLKIPTDPNTGLPTAERKHGPFKILKVFDKSSVKLYRALVTGEHLTTVTIKFYRIAPTGMEENYFNITLKNALIVNISPSLPNALLPENYSYSHMEAVTFVYQKIKWTWVPDGIEYEDTWETPR